MSEDDKKGERIAKALARAGLCSRRDAERWIADRRVTVNGVTLDTPAVVVGENDVVTVDGNPLPRRVPTRLWRYHKPSGLVTTHKDPAGRPTVFERLPPNLGRVISVGRLDLNSEGLLLLTNDGELARRLEHPTSAWLRRYRVRVHGAVDPERLARLEGGVTVEGVRYGSIRAVVDSTKGANSWLTLSLAEGKNREVRKVMEHLGLSVTRLLRIAYGPLQLGDLEKGAAEEVRGRALREVLTSVGAREAPTLWAQPKAKPKPRLHAPRPQSHPSKPRFPTAKGKPHAHRRRTP